jgi:hypothetical protein
MDPGHFDALIQTLGNAASRRHSLGAILTGLAASILPGFARADRKKAKGKRRGQGRGKSHGRGKNHGRKKRDNGSANDGTQADGKCRQAGHPCEGNQRCCGGLICVVSGPGQAERCTPCGDDGQPCCAGDVCGDGFTCADDGTCIACGGQDQPCCGEEACDGGFVCDANTGLCTACGGTDQPCCANESCDGGFVCDDDGFCTPCGGDQQLCCAGGSCDTGFTCDEGGTCACGGQGQPCCAGVSCDGQLVCDATGQCTSCGGAGQSCCEVGDACGTGLICAGGSCTPCGDEGSICCADEGCGGGLVCADDGVCASCDVNEVICVTAEGGQCVPGVCCEEGEGPGCGEGETCIAGGCITEGQVRIVLRWGEEPRDLDSHLWLPPESPYHIFWRDKGAVSQFPFAELDIDDITSFGPETITIADLQVGTYLYAVHLYNGVGTIGTSEAVVEVYKGATLLRTYEPPTDGPWDEQEVPLINPYNDRRIWWKVFELTSDGTDVAITDFNVASTDPRPYLDPVAVSGTSLRSASAAIPLKPPVDESAAKRRHSRRRRKNRGRGRR